MVAQDDAKQSREGGGERKREGVRGRGKEGRVVRMSSTSLLNTCWTAHKNLQHFEYNFARGKVTKCT